MTFESRHIGNRRKAGIPIIRMILMGVILIMALVMIRNNATKMTTSRDSDIYMVPRVATDVIYWPEQHKELVRHSTFLLSYDTAHRQAEWVAYVLVREDLERPVVGFLDRFVKDEKISGRSAAYEDFSGSGYSPGHLIPPEDRAWNGEVNAETYYMSNISPQTPEFNRGIWRELEENIRDWAKEKGRLFIVTGPVLNDEIEKVIGENEVSVPKYFYKALLCLDGSEKSAIAFLIPNEKSDLPLEEYARPVREVEEVTGIDFFSTVMLDRKLEDSLESHFDIGDWAVDPERYKIRTDVWNREQ